MIGITLLALMPAEISEDAAVCNSGNSNGVLGGEVLQLLQEDVGLLRRAEHRMSAAPTSLWATSRGPSMRAPSSTPLRVWRRPSGSRSSDCCPRRA